MHSSYVCVTIEVGGLLTIHALIFFAQLLSMDIGLKMISLHIEFLGNYI